MRFSNKLLIQLTGIVMISFAFFSCNVFVKVKDYPKDKPFVYSNKINLSGDLSKDEKKRLTTDLASYWDDSLNARFQQNFGVFYVLKKPPVFDSLNIGRTKTFMTGYLNSQDYYNIHFTNLDSSYEIDTVDGQIRTYITLNINPGKNTIIDSLSYNFRDTTVQQITVANEKKSVIKEKITPFSKQNVAAELDRLVKLYRQNGYYNLTRDDLVAIADTSDRALLEVTLDPFDLALKISQAAERRRQNPTASVSIEERNRTDSTGLSEEDSLHFVQYKIGDIYFFPETSFRNDIPERMIEDTAAYLKRYAPGHTFFYKQDLFRRRVMLDHSYQQKGTLYNEDIFYKTLNAFNQIGAWQRVDYRTFIRQDTVDFWYFLSPAKKETVSFNVEASRNTGDFLGSANLIGIAFSMNYINRNVWRSAIQSSTTFSNGVEFNFTKGSSLLQTFQTSLGQVYSFPRRIMPEFMRRRDKELEAASTQLSANLSYSDRTDYFRSRSAVAGFGWKWRKKLLNWQWTFPNLEFYSIDILPKLDTAIMENPFLKNSFNNGTVISTQAGFYFSSLDKKHPRATNFVRVGSEVSFPYLDHIKGLQDKIYEFVKLEAEYRRIYNYRKSSIAIRVYGGAGYNYGKSDKFGNTLPFFKQFVAGGPNSMRAWGLRLLGLGSSLVSDTSSTFRERYGDMQLEANFEYRFTIADFSSLKLGGAFFTDIGNVWNLHNTPDAPGSKFTFKNLGKDLAMGIGTGLRFDFSYFLIRVDFGIKVKDPARYAENKGWLKPSDFTWKNYLYADKGVETRNNYAVQLGIGLPF